MLKTFTLGERTYTEFDVQCMELSDIQKLITSIQSEVFRLSSEKRKLSTLPNNRKNEKTLKKLNRYTDTCCMLQDALCWVGLIKKQKRDVMAKERDWYKKFYTLSQSNIRKGQFAKISKQVEEELGYSIG